MSFTPGPWAYDPEINRIFSVQTNECVALPHILTNPSVMEQWPKDAKLLALAPELLQYVQSSASAGCATAKALLSKLAN